ncbi:RICIN domain-containing protein [Streptomyces sp. NRRL S-1448]|uniref:RICIN domain-containing protein n=1 Tax=Streptomyces sp. NRRL S-1448 TaxID=1463883 RepID=UPI0004C12E56|nr:RICIN domain-containing protein [Streptomyces sp. NRRL S-1448]
MASRKAIAAVLSASALLSVGLLSTGSAQAATVPTIRPDVRYTFQNVGSDRNLDAFGNDTLKSWTPDISGTQDFYLKSGRFQGYQLESAIHPGRCVTAKAIGQQIALEDCNSGIQAQYWDYANRDEGSALISRKFARGCIADAGNRSAVALAPCNGSDDQRWIPLIG